MNDEVDYVVVSQRQLDDVIKLHQKFLEGDTGGSRCIMKFMDLSGLNLKGKNMSNADFTGALLKGADLSEGNFENSSFFAADLSKANLENGRFKRSDFRGAVLSNANLFSADLQKADLREGVIMQGKGEDWDDYEKAISKGSRLLMF